MVAELLCLPLFLIQIAASAGPTRGNCYNGHEGGSVLEPPPPTCSPLSADGLIEPLERVRAPIQNIKALVGGRHVVLEQQAPGRRHRDGERHVMGRVPLKFSHGCASYGPTCSLP